MKVCSVCKQAKPASEYYKHNGKKDGLRSECKVCHEARAKARKGQPHVVEPDSGYDGLMKAIVERLVLDYKMGKTIDFMYAAGDGRTKNSEPDGGHWKGFCPCPQECLEVVMGRDFYDYYFHSISMNFDDSEIRAKILQKMGVK